MQMQKLRKYNIFAGFLHLASLLVVIALSNDFSLPVTAVYQSGPPGTTFTNPVNLFNLNVSHMVALFLGPRSPLVAVPFEPEVAPALGDGDRPHVERVFQNDMRRG